MTEKRLSFQISAKDDASGVFAKMARAAKREMGDVEDSLDDTRSAGKRMADAMSSMADELDQELDRTARAADALARALGPEFSSTVSKGDLELTVNQLRQAGLTMEDIEADAEELASAIKRIDDVGSKAAGSTRKAFDDVEGSVKRTGGEMERTGSVFANFAGNAIQDVPGIAGSFGALNVAAGQFAEYATEGGISLRNMAKAAGPIALVTLAIGYLNKEAQKAAEIKAFNEDQVKRWSDAMRQGASATEAVLKDVEDIGHLDLKGLGVDGEKLTDSLANLGLTVRDFLDLTGKSDVELEALAETMRAAGADGDDLATVGLALTLVQNNMGKATDDAAQKLAVYGQSEQDAAKDSEELAARLDKQKESMQGVLDATLALFDANLGYRQSVDGVDDAIAGLNETQNQHGSDSEEYRDALLDTEGAILDQAAAAVRLAEDNAKASGATLNATEKAAIYKAELEKVAGTLAPGSPLRVQLDGYIGQLHSVPSEIKTKLLTESPDGFKSLRELLGYLDAIGSHSAHRTMSASGLLRFKQDRLLNADSGAVVPGALGTPQLAVVHGGETISPTHRVPMSEGGTVINVYTSADPQAVVEAIKRYTRSNGPLPASLVG